MKKQFAALLCAGSMLFGLASAASAAKYQGPAEALADLGLFQGTEAGLELDRAPTRAEAGVMLVRLLGREEEALAGEYETPFTDLPAWCEKYVGYMYENGLANGMTETTFEPDTICNERMYPTFVLRALGYDDQAGDFTYGGAVKKAGEVIGVGGPFFSYYQRAHLVTDSYLALAAHLKDDPGVTLLDRLVADGAVDAEKAARYQEQFALLAEAIAAYAPLRAGDLSAKLSAKLTLSAQGRTDEISLEAAMKLLRGEGEGAPPTAEITGTTSRGGVSAVTSTWYSGEYAYIQSGGTATRHLVPSGEILAVFNLLPVQQFAASLTNIKKVETAHGVCYELILSDSTCLSLLDALSYSRVTGNRELTALTVRLDVDAAGTVTGGGVKASYDILDDLSGESIQLTADYFVSELATEEISIFPPSDLDSYTEIPFDSGYYRILPLLDNADER